MKKWSEDMVLGVLVVVISLVLFFVAWDLKEERAIIIIWIEGGVLLLLGLGIFRFGFKKRGR